MSKVNPRQQRSSKVDPGTILLASILGLVVFSGFIVSASFRVAAMFSDASVADVSWNPVRMWIAVIKGDATFTTSVVIVLIALISLIVVLLVVAWLQWDRRKPKTQVERAGKQYLSSNSDVSSLSRQKALAFARSNFSSPVVHEFPGLRMGHIPGNTKRGLYSTWEDLYLVIFGPRMGKTTTQVIPAIVDAPGPVVTTSNKRDIVDDTIRVASSRGEVFVFDPQNIAGDGNNPTWFFDPLDFIRRDEAVMDASAMKLADIFLCASREQGSQDSNSYFTQAGRDLLARMFLAAALDNLPIGEVYVWVNDERNRTPITILSNYPQWQQQAAALQGTYAITEKTRSGIFSQAQQMASALGRRQALQWVTPAAGMLRFSAYDFVRSAHDTLYVLSKEGADNAAALTTALVAMVMTEAERYGEDCGGRLPVPLVAALDEAANVVRWPELPQLYSHYGSRSIILMTILQSYAQGVGVWGEHGMEALWSASSVLLYGGGVRDERMLQKLESLIGEASERTRSVSSSRDGRSVSTSYQDRKILTVAELASIPAGRAVVLAAKRRPLIAALEPWWVRSWPDSIRENLGREQS